LARRFAGLFLTGFALATTGFTQAVSQAAPEPAPMPATEAFVQRYAGIKAGVAHWFDQHPEVLYHPSPANLDIVINPQVLPYEREPDMAGPPAPALDDELLSIARLTEWIRANLRSAGYPDGLYFAMMRGFEAHELNLILRRQREPVTEAGSPMSRLQTYIQAIETRREQIRPDLPALRFASYIPMMGGRPAIFRSNPGGGQVWIITQLRFEVCQATLPNPYDRTRCPRWLETDPNNPIFLSGTYAYQVAWPGGNANRGQRTVQPGSGGPALVFQVP
jgi:hypothetical protein